MARGVLFWRRRSPLTSVVALSDFCFSRTAHISQTTLYGYLRTRAGLQHFNVMSDPAFAEALRPARTRVIQAALADLILYVTAQLVRTTQNEAGKTGETGRDQPPTTQETIQDASHVARILYDRAARPLSDADISAADLVTMREAFLARAQDITQETTWDIVDEKIFQQSCRALVRHAPVTDTLKKGDGQIVMNSMRFKWQAITRELNARLVPAAILAEIAEQEDKQDNENKKTDEN